MNNQDLIKTITELKETIKVKDDKIKSLEEELDKYKQKNNNLNNNDISYNNFYTFYIIQQKRVKIFRNNKDESIEKKITLM